MVQFVNASLYGTPYVEVNPQAVTSVTQEKTEPPSCTLRMGKAGAGHYRVVGEIDQVCEALGRKKEELLHKGF